MAEKKHNWLDKLMARPFVFPEESAPGSPVVISSRIRLARNISGFAFPTASTPESDAQVAELVQMAIKRSKALGIGCISLKVSELDNISRMILLERQLASRELLKSQHGQYVHIARNNHCSIMVNEEDHLRIQSLHSGLQLHKAWKQVSELDDILSGELEFAYDRDLGYLTSCPSNVGTGIRVSVMLHLAALTIQKNIEPLERALAKLGLTMRGMYGEGSGSYGNMYQISNQSTLGESEGRIIEQLGKVVDQIVEHEEAARHSLLAHDRNLLLDKAGRSFGLLRYSYKLSETEALEALSGLRLGVAMQMFDSLDMQCVNELFNSIHSGVIAYNAGRELDKNECEALRAKIVRERLKQNGLC